MDVPSYYYFPLTLQSNAPDINNNNAPFNPCSTPHTFTDWVDHTLLGVLGDGHDLTNPAQKKRKREIDPAALPSKNQTHNSEAIDLTQEEEEPPYRNGEYRKSATTLDFRHSHGENAAQLSSLVSKYLNYAIFRLKTDLPHQKLKLFAFSANPYFD